MPVATRSEPRADKVEIVTEVTKRIDAADSIVATDYRGLDVDQMAELRTSLIEADTDYKIYKNSLVRRAAEAKLPQEFIDLLVGPTALAFVSEDVAAAAKALVSFAKENEELVIKGAILSGDFAEASVISQLATLPPRAEVLAQLAGGLNAPTTALASMMSNLLSEMAGLLDSLASKTPDTEAPAEEPPADAAPAEEPPADAAPAEEPPAEDPPPPPNEESPTTNGDK